MAKSNLPSLELRPGIWTEVRKAILGIMIGLLNDLKHGLRPREKYNSFGFTLFRLVVVPEPSAVKFAVCANETAVELYHFRISQVKRVPVTIGDFVNDKFGTNVPVLESQVSVVADPWSGRWQAVEYLRFRSGKMASSHNNICCTLQCRNKGSFVRASHIEGDLLSHFKLQNARYVKSAAFKIVLSVDPEYRVSRLFCQISSSSPFVCFVSFVVLSLGLTSQTATRAWRLLPAECPQVRHAATRSACSLA